MSCIEINGGIPLSGKVEISGFKNSVLPILYASVLVRDVVVLTNVPDISDVKVTFDILKSIGAVISAIGDGTYEVDTRHMDFGEVPQNLVRSMRGSYYLLGAELGRFGRAKIGEVGGCNFGTRPIDQHIKVFRALGATVNHTPTTLVMCADRLCGNLISFDVVSVGATINAILCAVLADGRTVLYNAAKEPHVLDLIEFLNKCGAKITGKGNGKIIIDGVGRLHGCEHRIISDMIEAGTYMTLGAIPGNSITVENISLPVMSVICSKIIEAGADVRMENDRITVSGRKLRPVSLETSPYPGFPTDMQPQFSALMTLADGISTVTERVWRGRFKYVDELKKMGADIRISGDCAEIHGKGSLSGADMDATDLRAGAALIIAALSAEGKSIVRHAELVKRGYENICGKLKSLGACIEEV